MALNKLPQEILEMIMDLLDPQFIYVAKLSCRTLFYTRRTLNELHGTFDPWQAYAVKALLEVEKTSAKLLCVFCQRRHFRRNFPTHRLAWHALSRHCGSSEAAIELGQSRLDLTTMKRALQDPASGGINYPSPSFIDGAGLLNQLPGLGLRIHSPFGFAWEGIYHSWQRFHIKNEKVILKSFLELNHWPIPLRDWKSFAN